MPSREEIPERVDAVLEVVHLIFTTGHTAPLGEHLVRGDLADRAVGLARLLRRLLRRHAEVAGLLALVLLTDARRASRVSPDGYLALLSDQDRSRWDSPQIAEGVDLVAASLHARSERGRPPTRFAVQAAIAAVHPESPTWADTDWVEIVGLYDVLRRLSRWVEAAAAYQDALALTGNEVERAFLIRRLDEVRAAAVGRRGRPLGTPVHLGWARGRLHLHDVQGAQGARRQGHPR